MMQEHQSLRRRQYMKVSIGTIACMAVARYCQALTLLRNTLEARP